jgi:hypothetical protein
MALRLLSRQCKELGPDWSVVIYWNQTAGWEVALYRAAGTAEMAKARGSTLLSAIKSVGLDILDDPISGVFN